MQAPLVASLLLGCASAFYLPGVAPRQYSDGEAVEIKVNKLDSVATQLPYDYYSLPFCQPPTITEATENLGEVLSGEKIETSPYKLHMKKLETCKVLCKKTFTKAELESFNSRIVDKYNINMLVDNIPAARRYVISDGVEEVKVLDDGSNLVYEKGFQIGDVQGKTANINNHVRFVIFYHEDPESFDGQRIVSFVVEAFSIKHKVQGEWKGEQTKFSTCNSLRPVMSSSSPQKVWPATSDMEIIFTYDVAWMESPIKWASRWDLYLKMQGSEVHWISIANSLVVVLFLSLLVAVIMIRTLYQDLARYNELYEDEQDEQDEKGWKLVHGDVFRPPQYAGMFAVFLGTGCQLIAMVLVMLLFACLGFLSPANRGGLLSALLLIFVGFGILAGYVSTRTYKMFGLTEWKTNVVHTAVFFPGTMFGGFFLLNLFVWSQGSTAAVPFGTLAALAILWLGVSAPLVYLGSFIAFKRETIEVPCRVNNIPRMLPPTTMINHPLATCVCAGLLPFMATYIEMMYIMTSVWNHEFYYMFGVLALVFLILAIICAELSIVVVYSQLCSENYHWWWSSFLSAGFSALYVFVYSIYYFATGLEIIRFVSGLLFFGYMLLASFAFFLVTGTFGHLASFLFVHKIYSSVKID